MNPLQLPATLRAIVRHPLNRGNQTGALRRFLGWQLAVRLLDRPVLVPFVNGTRLVVRKGMAGATQAVYCGLPEFESMGFLLHFLRPEDTFLDIGANVGVYTVLAAGGCGCRALAFEPIEASVCCLRDNLALNRLESRVEVKQAALGAKPGELAFTCSLDTMNHVLAHGERADTTRVPVTPLDAVPSASGAAALKLDVEGFEHEVLQGAARTLAHPALKAMVVEMNGSGARYGCTDEAIATHLLAFGFAFASYSPQTRTLRWLNERPVGGGDNVLFVRREEGVRERLRLAPRFQVLDCAL